MSDAIPTDRWTTRELSEQMQEHLVVFGEDMESGSMDAIEAGFILLLPVAADAGILYEDGYVYTFDLQQDHDDEWEPNKFVVGSDAAYEVTMEALLGQVMNASRGQLIHYVRWAQNAVLRG